MPTITSTGVGSGLDVNNIVSSLMALEQRPLTQLQQRAATIQTRLSAFGTLKGQVAALGDLGAKLADPASWNPLRADASDASVASLAAGTTASAGKYRLEVQQLAQSQSLASAAYASSSAVVGTGTLTFAVGTTTAGVFTPRAGSTPVTVTIGAGQNTLAGVRDAINAASAGVTASLVGSGAQTRLVLRTPDGADSSVQITAADDDGNSTDAAGLSALAFDPAAAAGSGKNLSQTQAAQDAKYTLDGLALTSPTNTAADAITGVTLTLRKVTTAPVDLTVSVETVAVRKNINDFVNAYNALAKLLAQQTQADPGGKNRGPLQADSTAVGLQSSLRELLRGVVSGLSGPGSLSAAGIELQRDGTLLVKDATLTPLLSNPASLAALFTQAQSGGDTGTLGLGKRIKQWADPFTNETGSLTQRMDGLKSSSTQNQKAQEALQDKLSRTEARLRAQYQRLDNEMSRLNADMARMKSSLGLNTSA
ncbi:flagellar filament capping protein FliD [Ramlibacter sp. MAHUQ-53]|uniref:flagellar filament capping protein FliD n=1 Tax=unclassified Ramlibacter TaxID=2617605 RepID=UPI0036267ACC